MPDKKLHRGFRSTGIDAQRSDESSFFQKHLTNCKKLFRPEKEQKSFLFP